MNHITNESLLSSLMKLINTLCSITLLIPQLTKRIMGWVGGILTGLMVVVMLVVLKLDELLNF